MASQKVKINEYEMAFGDWVELMRTHYNNAAVGVIPVDETTISMALTNDDCFLAVSSSAATITLPSTTTLGKFFIISNQGPTCTVSGNGVSISGAAAITLGAGITKTIVKSTTFVAY